MALLGLRTTKTVFDVIRFFISLLKHLLKFRLYLVVESKKRFCVILRTIVLECSSVLLYTNSIYLHSDL